MATEYRTGDLFEQPDVEALAHGVNCKGLMGAGIARVFKQENYVMYVQYRLLCDLGQLTLGKVMPWEGDEYFTFNMATQDLPGPHANLAAIGTAVIRTLTMCDRLKLDKVAMPRIGAGIGGLKWADVQAVLESAAKHVPTVHLIVVSLPEA